MRLPSSSEVSSFASRSKYDVQTDAAEQKLRDLVNSDEKLKAYLEGKEIKKFIIVPNKLISIVV